MVGNICGEFESYFQSPKLSRRPQPQTISAGGRSHCGRKIIRWKYRADHQRILRYWTKYAICCTSLI